MLFVPELESPIKTLDLPVAGKGYSADTVKLLFDFVNLANDTLPKRGNTGRSGLPDDGDGVETIKFLRKVRAIIALMCSDEKQSLGLHPAVYFYSISGRYQPTAFLATVRLLMEMKEKSDFDTFTERRGKFEDFLVEHRYFVNQIVNQFGSGLKGYEWVHKLYRSILDNPTVEENEMVQILINGQKWRLKESPAKGAQFDTETKNAIYLKAALASATRCGVCNARIHKRSMTAGHIERREDGGINHSSNGQLEHPYCNHDYKERKHRASLAATGPLQA